MAWRLVSMVAVLGILFVSLTQSMPSGKTENLLSSKLQKIHRLRELLKRFEQGGSELSPDTKTKQAPHSIQKGKDSAHQPFSNTLHKTEPYNQLLDVQDKNNTIKTPNPVSDQVIQKTRNVGQSMPRSLVRSRSLTSEDMEKTSRSDDDEMDLIGLANKKTLAKAMELIHERLVQAPTIEETDRIEPTTPLPEISEKHKPATQHDLGKERRLEEWLATVLARNIENSDTKQTENKNHHVLIQITDTPLHDGVEQTVKELQALITDILHERQENPGLPKQANVHKTSHVANADDVKNAANLDDLIQSLLQDMEQGTKDKADNQYERIPKTTDDVMTGSVEQESLESLIQKIIVELEKDSENTDEDLTQVDNIDKSDLNLDDVETNNLNQFFKASRQKALTSTELRLMGDLERARNIGLSVDDLIQDLQHKNSPYITRLLTGKSREDNIAV